MAMIMVLVMVIIFSSLILAVVISSTTAIRRAHYYKDKSTALQIAEAGLQDALYWMNYAGYSNHQYPCTDNGEYSPDHKYFQGSDYANSETWTTAEPSNYNPTGIQGGTCKVEFADNASGTADTITVSGYYKGRMATIKVSLMGDSGQGTPHDTPGVTDRWLSDWGWDPVRSVPRDEIATWGIPEAFNKHTIYARTVVREGAAQPIIKGNIFAEHTTNLIASAAEQYTFTKGYTVHFDKLTKPDTVIYLDDIPDTTPFAAFTVYFREIDGDVWGFDQETGGDTVISPPVAGITYDGSDYIFSETQIDYPFHVAGNVKLNGGSLTISQPFETTGNLDIENNNMAIDYQIQVGGNLTITQPVTTGPGSLFIVNGNALVNKTSPYNGSVTGDFVVHNAANVSLTGNPDINGALVADNVGPVSLTGTVDASASQYKAAIILNTAGDITLSSIPSVAIGDTQDAGILAYSSGGNVAITVDKSLYFSGKSAVIAYSNANTTVTISSGVNIRGLIYSHCGDSPTVNTVEIYTAGTLNGAIASNGNVRFNNVATTVTYDSDAYNDPEDNYRIYPNFTGGRRRYVPVPGSWEVVW